MPSSTDSLATWLHYIEQAHSSSIDMGLDRIKKVYQNLNIDFDKTCVVTVAGTNGKGTTCRFIEQVCKKAGYCVGVYSSPHILEFNERIRLNGTNVNDDIICDAFTRIEKAKKDISLTYFEYATLAALSVFADAQCQICILEVGLGGRLDATNIVDADIAAITSIGFDHQEYLGESLAEIANEKAGIIKANQSVVLGCDLPYENVQKHLQDTNNLICLQRNKDFEDTWIQTPHFGRFEFDLQYAKIPQQNIMTAIASIYFVSRFFEHEQAFLVEKSEIQDHIQSVSLPGRLELLQSQPKVILDVAHNEAAILNLISDLEKLEIKHCHVLVGMLKDKNIEACLSALQNLEVISWHCVDLPSPRGEQSKRFVEFLEVKSNAAIYSYSKVETAFASALKHSKNEESLLVIGSFVLASAVKQIYANSLT